MKARKLKQKINLPNLEIISLTELHASIKKAQYKKTKIIIILQVNIKQWVPELTASVFFLVLCLAVLNVEAILQLSIFNRTVAMPSAGRFTDI